MLTSDEELSDLAVPDPDALGDLYTVPSGPVKVVFDVKAYKQRSFTDTDTEQFLVLDIGKVTGRYFTIIYLYRIDNRLATRRERIAFIYGIRFKVKCYCTDLPSFNMIFRILFQSIRVRYHRNSPRWQS